jgi:HSP20 family protein
MHETIDDVIRDFFADTGYAGATVPPDWMPRTDIIEESTRYLVMLDLPGMQREDIKISVENGTLTITGERRREHEAPVGGYTRYERAQGSFTRTFSLPRTIDGNRIEAIYKDGVLMVVLPKSQETHLKSIEVKIN